MQHRIKKQVLQLLVDPGLDAFAIQQAASNCYWDEILPVLERVFDELSVEGICGLAGYGPGCMRC
jgi:hypothetical protein